MRPHRLAIALLLSLCLTLAVVLLLGQNPLCTVYNEADLEWWLLGCWRLGALLHGRG